MIEDRRTRLIDGLVVRMIGDMIDRLAKDKESIESCCLDERIEVFIEAACRTADKTIAATTEE